MQTYIWILNREPEYYWVYLLHHIFIASVYCTTYVFLHKFFPHFWDAFWWHSIALQHTSRIQIQLTKTFLILGWAATVGGVDHRPDQLFPLARLKFDYYSVSVLTWYQLGDHTWQRITYRSATSPHIVLTNNNTYLNTLLEPGPATPSEHIPIIISLLK